MLENNPDSEPVRISALLFGSLGLNLASECVRIIF
jgi:hypothetical protein